MKYRNYKFTPDKKGKFWLKIEIFLWNQRTFIDSIFISASAVSEETIVDARSTYPTYVEMFFIFLQKAQQGSYENDTELKLSIPDITKNTSIDTRLYGYE